MKRTRLRLLTRRLVGILLIGFISAYLLLMPMSNLFVRYVVWRLTSPAQVLQGRVKSNDAMIHYVSFGTGPAVLLLHGGLSNRLCWFSQVPWLVAAGRQVILLDTRGHGGSSLGKEELTYQLLAADAIAVMDTLRIQQADVIGWSDGGNTALMLGLHWPQRCKRLVTISANFSPSGLRPEAVEVTKTSRHGLSYWIKRWWTGAGDRLADLETRIQRLWRTRPQLQPDDLSKIPVLVLVIVGKKDVVSVAHAKQLAKQLPQGSLAVVPGGHSTPVTHPREVNDLIAQFLNLTLSK